MSDKSEMKKRQPKVIDSQTGAVFDVDPTPPQIKLATAADVRREMARVYRDARGKQLATADASRLSYILVSIGKMIELNDLEKRITELEGLKNGNN